MVARSLARNKTGIAVATGQIMERGSRNGPTPIRVAIGRRRIGRALPVPRTACGLPQPQISRASPGPPPKSNLNRRNMARRKRRSKTKKERSQVPLMGRNRGRSRKRRRWSMAALRYVAVVARASTIGEPRLRS